MPDVLNYCCCTFEMVATVKLSKYHKEPSSLYRLHSTFIPASNGSVTRRVGIQPVRPGSNPYGACRSVMDICGSFVPVIDWNINGCRRTKSYIMVISHIWIETQIMEMVNLKFNTHDETLQLPRYKGIKAYLGKYSLTKQEKVKFWANLIRIAFSWFVLD